MSNILSSKNLYGLPLETFTAPTFIEVME